MITQRVIDRALEVWRRVALMRFRSHPVQYRSTSRTPVNWY